MDFAAFSDDAFEAKAWVNQALRARGPGVTEDDHAYMLVMKLQTFIQKVNGELQDTSQQVVQDLPSVIRSIDVISQELGSLKERMALVKQDIEQVEQDTAHSMALLVDLDKVKSRMEETSGALQEADNWTTLFTDIEVAFAAEDLPKIASTLLAMQRSLMVLSDVPDYEDRQRRLVVFQNKLEALMSPRLLDAFKRHDLAVAKECYITFSDMGRLQQLNSYYFGCHKTPLQTVWSREAESGDTMVQWLPRYYEELSRVINEETEWVRKLFPEPEAVLNELVSQILAARAPPPSQTLEKECRQGSTLSTVLKSFQLTQEFVRRLPQLSQQALEQVFDCFVHYQVEFGTFLEREVVASVSQIDLGLTAESDLEQGAAAFSRAVAKSFDLLEAALDTCQQLTGMGAADGFCVAVSSAVSSLCARLEQAATALRQTSAVEGKSPSARQEDDEAEAWDAVHGVFKLIQVCGELIERCSEFEKTVRERVLARRGEPGAQQLAFDYLQNRPRPRKVLSEFVDSVRTGEPLLPEAQRAILSLNNQIHKFAFDAVLAPIQKKLATLSQEQSWANPEAVSEFSLAPLGYITKVGEQLLTLPQLLEPYIATEDDAIGIATKRCQLPYADQDVDQDGEEVSLADRWLGSVAGGTMQEYADHVLKLQKLTDYGAHQLCKDIDYLCNVLDALDVLPSKTLSHINQLLGVAAPEMASTAAELELLDPDVLVKLSQMRGVSVA